MYDYDADILELQATIEKLEDKKSFMKEEDYIKYATELNSYYTQLINDKNEQEDTYNAIKDEKDKNIYDTYRKLRSGTFDDNDKTLEDYGYIKYQNIIAMADDYSYKPYMELYNDFYRDDNDTVQSEKTIKMGKILFNKIKKTAESNNIDLINDLGVTYNSEINSFTIPRNKLAFIEFSKLYSDTMNNTFLNGAFINTANELFGEGNYNDGKMLNKIGSSVSKYEEKVKDIQNKYGVGKHYVSIISPYEHDITVDVMREMGYDNADVKAQKDYVESRIKSAQFINYRIYANMDDIASDNGGSNPLSEIYDTSIKTEIQNALSRGFGDSEKQTDLNQGDVKFSFATVDGIYGTMLTIPKGSGEYKVFVQELLPSKLAEMYVSQPDFQTRATLDEWNAVAKDRKRYNNIGSYFSGSFKAYGNNEFTYSLDWHGDVYKDIPLTREETHVMKQYSDYFRSYCLQNSFNSSRDTNNDNEIKKFITDKHSKYGISFVDVLSKISGLDEDLVVEYLLDDYNNYF